MRLFFFFFMKTNRLNLHGSASLHFLSVQIKLVSFSSIITFSYIKQITKIVTSWLIERQQKNINLFHLFPRKLDFKDKIMLNESIFTLIRDVKNDDNINNNCRLLMIYKLKCYRDKKMYDARHCGKCEATKQNTPICHS